MKAVVPVASTTIRTKHNGIDLIGIRCWLGYARRGYEDWWQALDWVRDGLIAGGVLREVEVTGTMPKARPWLARSSPTL